MAVVQVAVVFTDLVGSTDLWARLGVAEADELRHTHFRLLRAAVQASGGTEVKNLGDGIMAVFALPSAALSCAVALQQAFEVHNRGAACPLSVRVGISTGEATSENGDYFGDPVVEAARLCAWAEGGQILAAEVVGSLAGRRAPCTFRSVGDLELKGLPEPLPTVEVVWEAQPPGLEVPLPTRLLAAPPVGLFGRTAELDHLASVLKQVGGGEGCRTVLISGEPGLGKTTLSAAFARTAHSDGATVLYGRSEEDLGLPYQPFAEALTDFVTAAAEDLLATHVARYGGELAGLVPNLADRLGPALPPPSRQRLRGAAPPSLRLGRRLAGHDGRRPSGDSRTRRSALGRSRDTAPAPASRRVAGAVRAHDRGRLPQQRPRPRRAPQRHAGQPAPGRGRRPRRADRPR